MEKLAIKNTVSEMKNNFKGLIDRLNTTKLKHKQKKIKWKNKTE